MKNEWNHLAPNRIATNPHPEFGGIIDSCIADGLWFVIFNNDAIPNADGFKTKEEAFNYHKSEIARVARETSEYK